MSDVEESAQYRLRLQLIHTITQVLRRLVWLQLNSQDPHPYLQYLKSQLAIVYGLLIAPDVRELREQ